MWLDHCPAITKTIGKINSFTVSRCFISHIHSSNWVLPNNFENSNFVKNIFPVLHLLFLYKATLRLCSCLILETSPPDAAFSDWGFLFLILAFLYFYNFLFLFLHLGYFFFTHIWNYTSQRSIFHLFPRLWTSQAFRAFGKYVQDSDSSFSCYDRFLKPVAIELFL